MGKKFKLSKTEPASITLVETLRTEFNFLKYPFFDLTPRRNKRDKIEVYDVEDTPEGKAEIFWIVTRNVAHNFPSTFARRIHKEIIEVAINNLSKPISRLISLGSMCDICRGLGIQPSGKIYKDIESALLDIKNTGITARGTFRSKESSGAKKFINGSFNLYDAVFFAGESLPDGTEADSVYVLLSDYYVQNFNNNYVVPLDYQYFHDIEGGIASRMYEVLSIWFYPELKKDGSYIEKEYSRICDYFPLTRQNELWKAKKQLRGAHDQHLQNGFFGKEPEWITIQDKGDDWLIRYFIGPKVRGWYQKLNRIGESKQIGTTKEHTLTDELVQLGIAKKTAEILVRDIDNQVIIDQIRALPYRNCTDTAAFLIKAIRENYPLPAQIRKEKNSMAMDNEEQLRKKYREYLIREVDSCLEKIDQKQLELALIEHREVFLRKYPHYEALRESDSINKLIEDDFKKEKAPDYGVIGFEDWKKTIYLIRGGDED